MISGFNLLHEDLDQILLAIKTFLQFSSKPTRFLMSCIKQAFGYLKLTELFPLQYNFEDKSNKIFKFYSNSDFIEEKKAKTSRSGWIGTVFGLIFMWNSCKRTCTELSTSEAKYIATCEACAIIKSLRTLMAELRLIRSLPSMLFHDNTVSKT